MPERELSQDEVRWLSLGREVDTKRKLENWKAYRNARYDDYNRLVAAGMTGKILDELDADLKEINDKVTDIADEYEEILIKNRKRGWS